MRSIVAIGESAYHFAEFLSPFPEYSVYTLGNKEEEFKIPVFTKAERYEDPIDGLGEYISTATEKVVCVVSGGDVCSLATLMILEHLKDRQIEIVYLQPNLQILNDGGTKVHNLVYGVLQEMTRSKVFNRFYLFDLELVRKITPKVPLGELPKAVSQNCAKHYQTYNWLSSQKPIFLMDEGISANSVISTIAYCDFNLTTQSELGMIRFIREQEVFYGLAENKVKEDTELYDKVLKSFTDFKKDDIRTSFKVFSVPYTEDVVYVRNSTTAVQNKILAEALDKDKESK